MIRITLRIYLFRVVISAITFIFVGGCGGGGGGGGASPPATNHAVTLNWNASRESGVNSLGGGYQVSISGQPTIDVPYAPPGPRAPTTATTSLLTGVYTVTHWRKFKRGEGHKGEIGREVAQWLIAV